MQAADVLRDARRRSGLSLRRLAELAATSHSTIAAYESGSKIPSVATLDRLVRAAGFALDVSLARRAVGATTLAWHGPEARGLELQAVLDLAEAFPARHAPTLDAPVFGRR